MGARGRAPRTISRPCRRRGVRRALPRAGRAAATGAGSAHLLVLAVHARGEPRACQRGRSRRRHARRGDARPARGAHLESGGPVCRHQRRARGASRPGADRPLGGIAGGTYIFRVVHRRRTLRRGDFDVVHVMFMNRFTDPIDLALLGRRYSVVCTVHDLVPHDPRLPPAERWLARRLFQAGVLVVHNEQLRDLLRTEFDIDPARSSSFRISSHGFRARPNWRPTGLRWSCSSGRCGGTRACST